MDIALNTDFLTSRLSPEKYLRLTSEAGFTHLHWCHQWNTDYLYSASEIDLYKKMAEAVWTQTAGYSRLHGAGKTVVLHRRISAQSGC